MMKNKKYKPIMKNLIVISLILSSVFALTVLFINKNDTKEVLASEKQVSKERMKVYVGGDNIGIKISTKGILAVAFADIEQQDGSLAQSPSELAKVELGDIILKIDNKEISTSKELLGAVNENKNGKINLMISRNGNIINKEVTLCKNKDGDYKLGLWVRDSTAGIGTLTFIEDNTSVYGGLGHPITDSDVGKILDIKDGKLIKSTVVNVRRGEIGFPGELKGVFTNEKNAIGTIGKNTSTGIFGVLNEKSKKEFTKNKKLYEIGYKDEIKLGKAYIITTLDEEGPKMYEISIEKNLDMAKGINKNMLIKITDQELLEKSGGIVQGMSGSPIIQDDKIIGAVTHVLVNKPNVGYGIYIENMLKDANLLK
ncbi:MAG: SpoIVB peptidase [Sarcina sp.]